MWMTDRYRSLGKVDVAVLVDKVSSLSEAVWLEDEKLRQRLAGSRQTNSIFLKSILVPEFAKRISRGPLTDDDVPRQGGWDRLHGEISPIVESAVSRFPAGGIVSRIQLARMQPGTAIEQHIDQSPMLNAAHRLHIPLQTNSDVEFVVDGQRVIMDVGILYELNNRVPHSVVNRGNSARIHLIIDYIPPAHNTPDVLDPRFENRHKQRMMAGTSPRPPLRADYPLPTLIATSVVRGTHKNESHGGVYLIDMETEEIEQVVDWNTCDIEWEGRGWDRGLRGIAFHNQEIYIAASDELYCFDQNFSIVSSFRNPHLKHTHEMICYQNHLLITSTGFDSILRFDLETQLFDQGWLIRPGQRGDIMVRLYDPKNQGPDPGNTYHINTVTQDENGIYVSGLNMPSILHLHQGTINHYAALPLGTHNAMPCEKGVLYNDTNADRVVFAEGESCFNMDIRRYPEDQILNAELGDRRIARQAFGRGLCIYKDHIVIAGSSPSTITAYDLSAQAPIKSVNITMDIRNCIHGLEIYPF